MSERTAAEAAAVSGGRSVVVCAREGAARAAALLGRAEAEVGVVVREIPLDAIEPDPAQPRRVFDEEKLERLAASIRKYGVLQEPGVVPVEGEGEGGTERHRIVFGERRWRAARLAGLTSIRCKVFPRADGSTVEQLRARERQWAENMEREGLSPVEEAIAIQEGAELERKLRPEAPFGELVEKVGGERGLNGIVARNLVGLLKTPRSLQSAMMSGTIGREAGFELARFWNKLVAESERGEAKREIQYRRLVEAWARAHGAELDAREMKRYAAETFQDPDVVKATCRKAEEAYEAILARFDAVVARAHKDRWTVARTKAEVGDTRGATDDARGTKSLPCFEHAGKGRTRFTVHLDRVRDPAVATPEALARLLDVLRDLVREVEGCATAGAVAGVAGEMPAAPAAALSRPDRTGSV